MLTCCLFSKVITSSPDECSYICTWPDSASLQSRTRIDTSTQTPCRNDGCISLNTALSLLYRTISFCCRVKELILFMAEPVFCNYNQNWRNYHHTALFLKKHWYNIFGLIFLVYFGFIVGRFCCSFFPTLQLWLLRKQTLQSQMCRHLSVLHTA